jgi:GNAT superfamily N-acetyltransferase
VEYFLAGPNLVNCFVAEDEKTRILRGFQALERSSELPEDWADIATFARAEPKIPGVGAALFAATRLRSRDLGLRAINATIRADNTGGLIFYEKMGFEDYKTTKAVPLKDGTPIDRISKRYWVNRSASAFMPLWR